MKLYFIVTFRQNQVSKCHILDNKHNSLIYENLKSRYFVRRFKQNLMPFRFTVMIFEIKSVISKIKMDFILTFRAFLVAQVAFVIFQMKQIYINCVHVYINQAKRETCQESQLDNILILTNKIFT